MPDATQHQVKVERAPETMTVTSPAWEDGDAIPREHTCQGENVSPALEIGRVAADARALALVMDDPDAPAGTFTHWTAWNLPGDVGRIPRGADVDALGGREGLTDFGETGYGGPCPPSGTHRYFVKVYSLDAPLDLPAGASVEDLYRAMDGHVLAWGTLMGTYAQT